MLANSVSCGSRRRTLPLPSAIIGPDTVTNVRSDQGLSVHEFMSSLYRGLLSREPDPIGYKQCLAELDHGGRLEDAVRGMILSREFCSKWSDVLSRLALGSPNRGLSSSLALGFIVKDEGRYAVEMLDSITPLVSFGSCVDTGSTDDTIETVVRFLSRKGVPFQILAEEFSGFDTARNRAISCIPKEFDWILMLDADEIVLQKDYREIRALINQNDVDTWMIPRFNWLDRLFGEAAVYPDYQARLFRNYPDSRIRYVGRVHETLSGFSSARKLPVRHSLDEGSNGFHLHHIKLLRKTPEELARREDLYQQLGAQTETTGGPATALSTL
jgi:Domain of unknown function (DUF4214)/Glycosyl transferase family 2